MGPGPATSFSAAWTAACSVWTRAHASWSTLAGLAGGPGGGSGWDTPPRLLWPPPRARTGSCTSGTSSRGLLPAREMAAPDLGRPFPRSTGTRRAQSQASSSGTSRGCRPAPGHTSYPKIKVSLAEKLKALRCRLKCTTLLQMDGIFNKLGLLLVVLRRETGCCGRGRGPPGVRERPVDHPVHVSEAALDPGHHVGVRPHVLGLLLAPNDLRVGVTAELAQHEVKGEGAQLFHAADGHLVLQPLLGPLRGNLVVDLSRAQHEALGLRFLRGEGCNGIDPVVHNEPLEADALAVRGLHVVVEGRQRGLALREPQKILRGHDQQGLPELPMDLAAQEVEVVRRGGDVRHLPVLLLHLAPEVLAVEELDLVGVQCAVGEGERIVVAHLQEALETGAGVLRALPVVPVREKDDAH